MGAQAAKKIRSSEHKKGPKQINLDRDGHNIIPIQMFTGEMRWWCNTCADYVKKVETKLVPRKKGGS